MPTTDPENGQLSIDIAADTVAFKQSLLAQIIDQPLAQHLAWHFGDVNLGLNPGTFTERLLQTISAADTTNRDRLSAAFPAHVAGFRAVANEPWGLEFIRDIARGS